MKRFEASRCYLQKIFVIHFCKNIEVGLEVLKENKPEIMFLDYLVNGEIGLGLIDRVKEEKLDTSWAIMTSYKRMISDKDLDKSSIPDLSLTLIKTLEISWRDISFCSTLN